MGNVLHIFVFHFLEIKSDGTDMRFYLGSKQSMEYTQARYGNFTLPDRDNNLATQINGCNLLLTITFDQQVLISTTCSYLRILFRFSMLHLTYKLFPMCFCHILSPHFWRFYYKRVKE